MTWRKEPIRYEAEEYRCAENMLDTGHPAVMGLLNTKRNIAQSQGIEFAVAVKCDISRINIPPWGLNSILGNLLDNAIEAAIYDVNPPGNHRIPV
ncbi:hypothetical protein [Thermosyntropha sp.]|uniref:hypothetical protein n=1 Tax=Thermosyntropha sp. TaxID=2740820 RepID=UPI0025F87F73|nr:hypothetical protein [Thermosyntropha sp.]MBO8158954.1 hypothetical protein [Thermosyntropha sp.]